MGPAPLELDYRALKEHAEAAEFAEATLRWVEWARWSGRQQALAANGRPARLAVACRSRASSRSGRFSALAPWVHVGKGATMGLGAMRVTAA